MAAATISRSVRPAWGPRVTCRSRSGRAPRPRSLLVPTVVGAAVGLLALVLTAGTWRAAVIGTFIAAVIGLSLVVVTGYAGQVSLAQLALAGTAAFSLSTLTEDWGVPFPFAPVLAALVATAIGVVVGLPALRTRGLTLGIVTLEDLLTAMVGEIVDEDGSPKPAAISDPGLLEVDASAPVVQIEARFGVEFPAGQAKTLGGRLVELAGRFPASGERFLIRGLELDVLHASPTRIERVLVRRGSPGTTELDRSLS